MTVRSPLNRDLGIVISVTPVVPLSPCTLSDNFFACSSNFKSDASELDSTLTSKSLPPALTSHAFGLTTTNLVVLSNPVCIFSVRLFNTSAFTSAFACNV